MKLRGADLSFALVALLVPAIAFAQDDEGGEPAASEEKTAGGDKQPAEASKTETAPEDPSERFRIRRGFFAETDLGVYFTFGGRNTNDFINEFPKKTISNVQPYLALTFGYDLVHSEGFALSGGLRLSAGYSGGAGRVSDADLALGVEAISTRSSDFAVLETGVALAAAIFMSDRLALTVKADGGMAAVDPNPTLSAAEDGAGAAVFAPIFGGGLGLEYFTLLNDFSVGLDLRFAMVLISGASIPSASVSVPIKYTF
jgi:hypothetical protein